MASTTSANVTTDIPTTVATTTPFLTTTITSTSFFETSDGRTVLAFLVLIFLLLILTPVAVYIIVRKFCWIKVHHSGPGEWSTQRPVPASRDRHKKTQTDVKGSELDEFYRRRQPTDMTTYNGKPLPTIEPAMAKERWSQLNPKSWNDPWSSKFAKDKKNSSYINKLV